MKFKRLLIPLTGVWILMISSSAYVVAWESDSVHELPEFLSDQTLVVPNLTGTWDVKSEFYEVSSAPDVYGSGSSIIVFTDRAKNGEWKLAESNTTSTVQSMGDRSKNDVKRGDSVKDKKFFSENDLENIIHALLEKDVNDFSEKFRIVKERFSGILKFELEMKDHRKRIDIKNLSKDKFDQIHRIIDKRSNAFHLNPVLKLWTESYYYKGHTTKIEITVCENPKHIYFSAIYLE